MTKTKQNKAKIKYWPSMVTNIIGHRSKKISYLTSDLVYSSKVFTYTKEEKPFGTIVYGGTGYKSSSVKRDTAYSRILGNCSDAHLVNKW